MGFTSAVEWWDESKLQVLVLASLGIQYFLAVFAKGRKFSIPSWYRLLIWLSFLGSDSVAIYTLAALFNRHKELHNGSQARHGSRDLEVFWAPILLMHLGGQVFITAYNIEDNELWRRHIVTAISQVTVALYVFCVSWPSSADKRILSAAILLFLPGILRCFTKPLAFKHATFESLRYDGPHIRKLTVDMDKQLEIYIGKARTLILGTHSAPSPGVQDKMPDMRELFVDSAYTYSLRLTLLKSFLDFDDNMGHFFSLQACLSNFFNILYTKKRSTLTKAEADNDGMTCYNCCGPCTGFLCFFMPIVAIALFHSSHKQPYVVSDVVITFVLLYGTLFLDVISEYTMEVFADHWTADTIAQHSMIGYFARNKRHSMFTRLASCLQCKDFVDQHWPMEPCYGSLRITGLVREHVLVGWNEYITDVESYREFGDFRGQWTLERHKCDQHLGWSLEKSFDESVLLWHMATDFCLHELGTSVDYIRSQRCTSPDYRRSVRCKQISHYMMHLLFANPEMLMAGTRKNLFKVAYNELKDILDGTKVVQTDEEKLAQEVITKLKHGSKQGFIPDGWVLAKGLMDLDGEKIWKVILGVWLEMLCFSAGRSRGYLHAKSLGTGGEFLSYVWLVLAQAGLETFPERLQRTQRLWSGEEEEEDADPPSASRCHTEEENAASQLASRGTEEEETHATSHASQGVGIPELEIVVSP